MSQLSEREKERNKLTRVLGPMPVEDHKPRRPNVAWSKNWRRAKDGNKTYFFTVQLREWEYEELLARATLEGVSIPYMVRQDVRLANRLIMDHR